jgi:hypothetical protein
MLTDGTIAKVIPDELPPRETSARMTAASTILLRASAAQQDNFRGKARCMPRS